MTDTTNQGRGFHWVVRTARSILFLIEDLFANHDKLMQITDDIEQDSDTFVEITNIS